MTLAGRAVSVQCSLWCELSEASSVACRRAEQAYNRMISSRGVVWVGALLLCHERAIDLLVPHAHVPCARFTRSLRAEEMYNSMFFCLCQRFLVDAALNTVGILGIPTVP